MPKKTDKKPIITRKQKITAALLSEFPDENSTKNGNAAIEYLDNPVKADVDIKNYRVIKLQNGLRAVLISRPQSVQYPIGNLREKQPTVDTEKSENDDEENPKLFEQLMEIAGPPSMATCKLSINVGNYSDSRQVPFISHILGNIFLKASQKYSQLNSFLIFLLNNDGWLERSTDDCESTSFAFIVPTTELQEATDRFTNCFINPILKRDWIMAERDKLYKKYRTMDKQFTCCKAEKEHLFKVLATDSSKNPGYSISLNYGRDLFDKTSDRLCYEVNNFMTRHYSANRMVVAIEAEWSLDQLESCVRKYFSRIPNNGLSPIDLSAYSYDTCFDFPAFKMLYEIETCHDKKNKIEINWPMPSVRTLYRSKPHGYLSWLFQNEWKGSLMDYLYEKGWCTEIESGTGKCDFEDSTIYSLFNLTLTLTESGVENQKQILDTVYSYVNFLKQETGHKRAYDQLRLSEEVEFRFDLDVSELKSCAEICNGMHVYPSIDCLTGDFLYYEYDPEHLKICLDCMKPEKANLIIHGRNMMEDTWSPYDSDSNYKNKELVYYQKRSIPRDWINQWNKISPLPFFGLPKPNKFCPDHLTLVPIPKNLTPHPVKIHSDNLYEVWHKFDNVFRKPECHIKLILISHLQFESIENGVLLDMFALILNCLLWDELLPAREAGYNYAIESNYWGISISVNGFNQKFSLPLQTIAACMNDCSSIVNALTFDAIKEKLMEDYCKKMSSCADFAEDMMHSILRPINATKIEKHTAAAGIKFEQLKHFAAHYTDRVYVKALVQGNITASDALGLVRNCIGLSMCGPFGPSNEPRPRKLELERGVRCCRVQNVQPPFDVNHVTNYYQFGPKTIQSIALIDLLMMLITHPTFASNRDRERLDDYGIRPYYGCSCVPGYILMKTNFGSETDVASIDLQIENYRRSLGKILNGLRTVGWLIFKEVYSRFWCVPDQDLDTEMARNWLEITSGEYIFDRRHRQFDSIAQFKDEDLCKLLVDLTTIGPKTQKLSVQVTGRGEPKVNIVNVDGKDVPRYEIKLLTDSPGSKVEKQNYFITDIPSYKATLRSVSTKETDSVN